jgi:hypothetical protein
MKLFINSVANLFRLWLPLGIILGVAVYLGQAIAARAIGDRVQERPDAALPIRCENPIHRSPQPFFGPSTRQKQAPPRPGPQGGKAPRS